MTIFAPYKVERSAAAEMLRKVRTEQGALLRKAQVGVTLRQP